MSNTNNNIDALTNNQKIVSQGRPPWLNNKNVKQREFDYHPGVDRVLTFRGKDHYKIRQGESVVVIVSDGLHTRQSVIHRPFGEGLLPPNVWVVSEPEELDTLRMSEAQYSKAVKAREQAVTNHVKCMIMVKDEILVEFVKAKLNLDLEELIGKMDFPSYQKIRKEATKLKDEEVAAYKVAQIEKNFESYLDKETLQNAKRPVKDQFSQAKLENEVRERINKEVSNKKFPIDNYLGNAAKAVFPGKSLDDAKISDLCTKWGDVMKLNFLSCAEINEMIDEKESPLPNIINRSGEQQKVSVGLSSGKSSGDVVNDVHRLVENGLASNLRVPFPDVLDVWKRLGTELENASKVSDKIGQLEAKIKAYEKFTNTLFLDVSRNDDIVINKIRRVLDSSSKKKTSKKWSLFPRGRSSSPPKEPGVAGTRQVY